MIMTMRDGESNIGRMLMKILFKEGTSEEALQKIRASLKSRHLGELVQIKSTYQTITVQVNKMGRSTLEFEQHALEGGGFEWKLVKEKLAFAHKVLRSDILSKLENILEPLGGSLIR